MSSIPGLDLNGSLSGTYTSNFYDVSMYTHIRLLIFCNSDYQLKLYWSLDKGVNSDYVDTYSYTGGVSDSLNIPVRAKYISVQVIPSVSPSTVRLESLFINDPVSLLSLQNTGSGAKLYKEAHQKIRTLTSTDGSVILTQLTDTIDVSSAGLAIDSRDYTFSSNVMTIPMYAPANPLRAFWSDTNSQIIFPYWVTPEYVGVLRSWTLQPSSSLVTSSNGFMDVPTNLTGGSLDFHLIEITSDNYDTATATYNTIWSYSVPYTDLNTAVLNYTPKYLAGNLCPPISAGKKLSMYMENNLTASSSPSFRDVRCIFTFSKLQATEPLTTVGQVSATVARSYPRVNTLNVIQLDLYSPTRPDLVVDLITEQLTFTSTNTYTFNVSGTSTQGHQIRIYVNGLLRSTLTFSVGSFSGTFPPVSLVAGDVVQLIYIDGGTGNMTLGGFLCTIVT